MGRPLIIMLLLACCLPAAEIKPGSRVPEHSLVRVHLTDGERATVLGQDFSPVDQTATPYGIAFVGPPNRYAVLVITESGIDTLVVEIIGRPGPKPPKPDPDDDDPKPPSPPPPDDEVPDDVPNKLGLGHQAWQAAVKLEDGSKALKLGNKAVSLANQLHRGQILFNDAMTQWKQEAASLGQPWRELSDWLEARMTEKVFGMESGQLAWRDAFWEVGQALQRVPR